MRRDFLMKGKEATGDEDISGWYWSEKLDGMRCMWDGGVTRGAPISVVPWSNLREGLATGLWSYYGNPIYAPDWFLNNLPNCLLDGELFAGRGNFQDVMSICRKLKPIDQEWEKISYQVFSTPQMESLFRDGEIKSERFNRDISFSKCWEFIDAHATEDWHHLTTDNGTLVPFYRELEFLEPWLENADTSIISLHRQIKLPKIDAWEAAMKLTTQVVSKGAEGGIVRNWNAPWVPKRVGDILKIKPTKDAEGVIIGATAGKTGKLKGLVGNFVLLFNDKIEFELSGFTDEERQVNCPIAKAWAEDHPGERFPVGMLNEGALQFDLGQQITFKYREFTRSGTPKEARYLRIRPSE